MSFGQSDELLRGDDKTSATLKSPITIYAGDGLEGGFTFVRVRLYDSFLTPINNHQPSRLKFLRCSLIIPYKRPTCRKINGKKPNFVSNKFIKTGA